MAVSINRARLSACAFAILCKLVDQLRLLPDSSFLSTCPYRKADLLTHRHIPRATWTPRVRQSASELRTSMSTPPSRSDRTGDEVMVSLKSLATGTHGVSLVC